ncbi:MAG: hypothetical protein ACJAS9_003354 [Polaribacter sp.]|jgi:hypothetical protein
MLEILLYQEKKHKLIAEICVSGIIISNGFLVEHLIGYLNDNRKVVKNIDGLFNQKVDDIDIKVIRTTNTEFSAQYHT